MHVEIFLAVMVLAVALLVAADFFRRASEGPHEDDGRPAYEAAGRGSPSPPPLAGPARPAVTAFQPVRAGRTAASGASADAGPSAGTGVPPVKGKWLVRTRLSLLTAASALAAAVATASAIRAVGVMRGASFHSDVSSIKDGAAVSAIAAWAGAIVALAVGAWAARLLIRSVLRPLDQLRAAAAELADVRLPDALRGGGRGPLAVRSVGVTSSDEIGQIARAFDQVQAEVLGLTSNDVGLRGKLGEMFVELSSRSQNLVERQLRLIDELEQGEQDAERLASLFKMDHIATRMRRYSQNLLVLAGHELPGEWTQPVPLVDVIRAAVSEIEDYERVALHTQPGISVAGPAVRDLVHLLAELAENATALSAVGTPVDISGRALASGGTLIEVTDQGVGMNPQVLAEANRRLDSPPAMDFAVSRNMGLFVVGRLAARHGIKVRLQPAAAGGLTALIWLPDAVASGPDNPIGGPASGRLSRGDPSFDSSALDSSALGSSALDSSALGSGTLDGGAFDGRDAGPGRGAHAAAPAAERESVTASMWSAPVLEDVRPPSAPPAGRPARHAWPDSRPQPSFHPHPQALADPGSASPPAAFPAPSSDFPTPPAAASSPSAAASPVRTQPSCLPQRLVASPRPAPAQPSAPARLPAQPSATSAAPPAAAAEVAAASAAAASAAAAEAEERRLPIYDAVESDWFGNRRKLPGGAAAASGAWSTQADPGWDAASAAAAPASGGTTTAGLPVRMPRANLVPGSIGAQPDRPPIPRSASAVRDRLSGFQRGTSHGRAVLNHDGEDQAP